MFEFETWNCFPEGDIQKGEEKDDVIPVDDESDHGAHSANCVESYFKEMAGRCVLTREEEVELAQKIEQLKQRLATWICRYPCLLPEGLPTREDEPERPAELSSLKSEEITEDLVKEMDRNFSSMIYELGPVEMTGANKDLLNKDYQEFLEVRDHLRNLKSRFVEANLRLVISVARKFRGRGIPFLDLIQEGNLGLMRAVDKFDYRLGYKFSTYALWWIRQAMHRVIQNHAQTIRTPVHVSEMRNKVKRAIRDMSTETGSRPSLQDIVKATGLPKEKVTYILGEGEWAGTRTISLETPIGDGETQLLDFVKDEESASPEEAFMEQNTAREIKSILSTLSPREETIVRKRFGIGDDKTHTLEELGQEFGVTRERIRQIEAKALRKLRHPCRGKSMRALCNF